MKPLTKLSNIQLAGIIAAVLMLINLIFITVYIGREFHRNTLPLLLFSPLFTILAKLYQPHLLRLEPSGALFLLVSVFIATAGSLAIAWVSDKLRISLWFFGREKSIS